MEDEAERWLAADPPAGVMGMDLLVVAGVWTVAEGDDDGDDVAPLPTVPLAVSAALILGLKAALRVSERASARFTATNQGRKRETGRRQRITDCRTFPQNHSNERNREASKPRTHNDTQPKKRNTAKTKHQPTTKKKAEDKGEGKKRTRGRKRTQANKHSTNLPRSLFATRDVVPALVALRERVDE